MRANRSYEIYSIPAQDLLAFGRPTPDGSLSFVLDERATRHLLGGALPRLQRMPDCALFYQLQILLAKAGRQDLAALRQQTASIRQHLVYVDFTAVIRQIQDAERKAGLRPAARSWGSAADDNYDPARTLEQLFFHGFTLTFPGLDGTAHDEPSLAEPVHDESSHDEPVHDEPAHDEPVHDSQIKALPSLAVCFVRCEKSGGMSRANQLSFVDAACQADLAARLNLGLVVKRCIISKYAAYKGLALSAGLRVDPPGLILNQQTVVVVADARDQLTDDLISLTAQQLHDRDYHPTRLANTPVEVNFYDGAGLISPAYARIIAEAVREPGEIEATSFQFRLPFGKGMLHRCDFHGFFKEKGIAEIRDCLYRADGSPAEKQLHTHRIEDVQVILTQSQFKGLSWFKDHVDRSRPAPLDPAQPPDCFAYYWQKFQDYRQALTIVATNRTDPPTGGRTRLNYQVLHTLPLPAADFQGLADANLLACQQLRTDIQARLDYFSLRCQPSALSDQAEEDDSADPMPVTPPETADADDDRVQPPTAAHDALNSTDSGRRQLLTPIIAEAVRQNPALLREPRLIREVTEAADARLIDFSIGRLLVRGGTKHLSGDLLRLLYHCADFGRPDGEKLAFPQRERLEKGSFYAAQANYDRSKTYALFRNPHIARNEHVTLKPFQPPKTSERHRYFHHLRNVVMVHPLVSERLAGADYDGDLVKIIEDGCYCAAAARIGQAGSPDTDLIKMPAPKSVEQDVTPANEFRTLLDTFSSRVGLLCNYAFKNSVIAYNENAAPDLDRRPYAENVQALALLTGLEIDSAKTGYHPDVAPHLIVPTESYFLAHKQHCDQYNSANTRIVTDLDSAKIKPARPTSQNRRKRTYFILEPSAQTSNIDRLPYLAYQARYGTRSRQPDIAVQRFANQPLFRFEQEGWTDRLDRDRLEKMAGLILAYTNILKNIRCQQRLVRSGRDDFREQIEKILQLQYGRGGAADRLPAMADLLAPANLAQLYEIKRRLYDQYWQFTEPGARTARLQAILDGILTDWAFAEPDRLHSAYLPFLNFANRGYNLLDLFVRWRIEQEKAERQREADDQDDVQRSERILQELLADVVAEPDLVLTAIRDAVAADYSFSSQTDLVNLADRAVWPDNLRAAWANDPSFRERFADRVKRYAAALGQLRAGQLPGLSAERIHQAKVACFRQLASCLKQPAHGGSGSPGPALAVQCRAMIGRDFFPDVADAAALDQAFQYTVALTALDPARYFMWDVLAERLTVNLLKGVSADDQ